jgi:RimJ/RimL family protein N-acetyltransferase
MSCATSIPAVRDSDSVRSELPALMGGHGDADVGEIEFPGSLDTPNLELRSYTGIDVSALLALIDRNRQQLMQSFAPIAKAVVRAADADAFVKSSADQWTSKKEFIYGIWHKPSKELIGQLKVKTIVWDIPAAELSYFICQSSRRKGFATEAVSATLRATIGQMRFKRICLRIIASNAESLRLAGKLGFKREGLHRSEFRCGFGELHDIYHYALTSEDPLPPHRAGGSARSAE